MSDDKKIVSLVAKKAEEEEETKVTIQELVDKMQKEGELEELVVIGLNSEGMLIGSTFGSTSKINLMLDAAKLNLLTSV